MNNFNLLVKYFDARWTGDILSSYSCFLQVDSKSEILAGRAKAIHVLLHFIRRVCGRAASWAQRKLRKRFSRILVLAFHLVRLKNLPQDLVRMYIPSVEGPEACFSRMTKTIPNKVGTINKVSEVDHYEKI